MEVENYLAQKVNNILAGAFGPNQAMVSVDAVLNFNESTITKESILPSADGGVLRRRETRTPSGSSVNGESSTTDIEYQFGRSVEQLVERPGGITRLSVGVVVPAGTSDERRQAIGDLVAATVGLDKSRGDSIALYSLAAPGAAGAGLEVKTEMVAPAVSVEQVSEPTAIPDVVEEFGLNQSSLAMTLRLAGLLMVVLVLVWMVQRMRAGRAGQVRRLSAPEREQFVIQVQGWLNEGRAEEERSTIL
jgi:flagellar M-ring protein FliF